MAELRDGAKGGIPWFAILDSLGTVMVTSNDSDSKQNIGFPSEPSGQLHFRNTLHQTHQRLTDDEVDQLMEKLASE